MAYSADDLALAALLRIVPGGYRLVDASDQRFVGVRDRFVRLAMRHVGPRPSLVGFCGPDQDPRAAAAAAAGWASPNLVPTAIQRRVEPGVVVVALHPPAGVAAGRVAGSPVRTAIWTVRDGRARTPARPPGSPSPRLLRQAVASLERGEPPPSIGTIDVAERALMYGRGTRRGFTFGGGAGIIVVLLVLFGLRVLPGFLAGRSPGRGGQGQGPCAGVASCVEIGPGSNGTALAVPGGSRVVVRLSGQAGCLEDSAPAVLVFEECITTGGDPAEVVSVYRAAAPGRAELGRAGFSVSVSVR
jgi:hypothetical protein